MARFFGRRHLNVSSHFTRPLKPLKPFFMAGTAHLQHWSYLSSPGRDLEIFYVDVLDQVYSIYRTIAPQAVRYHGPLVTLSKCTLDCYAGAVEGFSALCREHGECVEAAGSCFVAARVPTSSERVRVEVCRRLCELNVERQLYNVCTSPTVQAAWARGQSVSVHAFVYSLADGLLKARGPPPFPSLTSCILLRFFLACKPAFGPRRDFYVMLSPPLSYCASPLAVSGPPLPSPSAFCALLSFFPVPNPLPPLQVPSLSPSPLLCFSPPLIYRALTSNLLLLPPPHSCVVEARSS